MRRRLSHEVAAIALLACLLPGIAVAAPSGCDDDTLQSKTNDGSVLIMTSGAVYQVLPGDNIDSMLWLPIEDVLICPHLVTFKGQVFMTYEIVNVDEHEKVGATRLR